MEATVWQIFNTLAILGLIVYKIRSDMKWKQRFDEMEMETKAALNISKGHAQLTEAAQREVIETKQDVEQALQTVKKVASVIASESGDKIKKPSELDL